MVLADTLRDAGLTRRNSNRWFGEAVVDRTLKHLDMLMAKHEMSQPGAANMAKPDDADLHIPQLVELTGKV
jgi:hypothetical protein